SIRIIAPSASVTCRSGWVRPSTRRGAPRSAPASARAAGRFPTPAGPWEREACAGPSASAASSRRFASACSGMSANVVTDLRCDLGDASAAVDHDVALSEPCRQRQIRRRPAGPERRPGALDAIALVAHAGERGVDVDLDEERQIGKEAADGGQVEREHVLDPELAAGTL